MAKSGTVEEKQLESGGQIRTCGAEAEGRVSSDGGDVMGADARL